MRRTVTRFGATLVALCLTAPGALAQGGPQQGSAAEAKPAGAQQKAPSDEAAPTEAQEAEAAGQGEAKSCPCDKKIAMLEAMAEMHRKALEMLKNDPVLKVKGFKGKARKMYVRKAKADKKFHKSVLKALEARIKFLKKMHKGNECKMHKAMSEAPDEVKQLLRERHKAMAEMRRKVAEMWLEGGEGHGAN